MIISGKQLAAEIKEMISRKVASYKVEYGREPHLSVILVGDDPSSRQYVRSKGRYAGEVGFSHETINLPEETTEEELIEKIHALNSDKGVDGILVQLPLPKHIRKHKVIEEIDPDKDVDGFQSKNVDALWHKLPGTRACTPKGIIKLLDKAGVEIAGKHAVVIGRSNIVGKPVATLMMQKGVPGDATVTVCHRATRNLKEICRQADIIIAAMGVPGFVTADMVKEGATVIDVGTTRVPDATRKSGFRLRGDVEFDEVAPKCAYITPVPGGVGPMTIVSLMRNTLLAGQKAIYK